MKNEASKELEDYEKYKESQTTKIAEISSRIEKIKNDEESVGKEVQGIETKIADLVAMDEQTTETIKELRKSISEAK